MVLNPKPAEKMEWTFRDGWQVVDGLKVSQSMFVTNLTDDGKEVTMFKGVKKVCFCARVPE